MYDCVFPTRTAVSSYLIHESLSCHDNPKFKISLACMSVRLCLSLYPFVSACLSASACLSLHSSLQRFGTALVPWGRVDLRQKEFARDFRPIDSECPCSTCRMYTRAFLHVLITQKETVACNYITVHNLHYQVRPHPLQMCALHVVCFVIMKFLSFPWAKEYNFTPSDSIHKQFIQL